MNTRKILPLIPLLLIGIISCSLPGSTKSTETANKVVATRYINEVINQRKTPMLKGIFSDACTIHMMNGKDNKPMVDGLLTKFLEGLFNSFPDLHYNIDNMIAEKDKVAIMLTAKGTQVHEFLGMPATNNIVTYREAFFFRFADKKIVEGWGIVDLDGIKTQIAH